MEVYSTEEQQVEAIKKWWHENRWSLIGGVVIGIAVLLGGRAWLENKQAYGEAASTVYQLMMQELSRQQYEQADVHGKQLLADFADTPYAALAALGMAKIKLEGGDQTASASYLRWVLENAGQEPVRHAARLRLARLLLADNKPDEAQALLQAVDYGAFAPAYQELQGDIHLAAGRQQQAREAYLGALATIAPAAPGRDLLQMKLDDLGSVTNN